MTPEAIKQIEPLDCIAAGMVVADDKDKITIASTTCPTNGHSGGIITIPKKSIRFYGEFDVGLDTKAKDDKNN
jgi:hypothetical protein